MTIKGKRRCATLLLLFAFCAVLSVSDRISADAATATFALDGEYNAVYAENEDIDIFAAAIVWKGAPANSYGVMIEKDGEIVDTFTEVREKFHYTLGSRGKYTVKYFFESGEGIYNKHFKFEVKKRLVLSRAEFPAMIGVGRQTILPSVYARYDGQQWKVEPEVFAPAGNTVALKNGSFVPETLGDYIARYTFSAGGENITKEYTMQCAVTPSSLFGTLDDYTTLEDNFDLPAYSVEGNGVLVLGIGSSSGVFTKHSVDLNELGKEDNLFALQTYVEGDVQPFRQMNVTIADSLDPNNAIQIKYERVARLSPNSRVSVNYNGNWYGMCNESYKENFYNKLWLNRYGTLLNKSSFYPDSNVNNGLFALRFDYSTKQIWALSGENEYSLVIDLDDGEQILETGAPLGDQIWQGFSSSKIDLSIAFEYVENKAGMIITEIAGQPLGGDCVQDDAPPVISVAKSSETPLAVVGRAYPLFAAEALDTVCGACAIQVSVIGPNGKSASIENGSFTPFEAGEYTISYTAADLFGHSRKESVVVTAVTKAQYSSDPIKLKFVSEPARAFVGDETLYYIPEIEVCGGAGGEYETEFVYRYGSEEFVPNEQRKIRLHQKKDIVITAKIRDYLGTEAVQTLTIRVYSPQNVVMEVEGVPDAVATGEEFRLPAFSVTDYFDSAEPEMSVTVNGKPVDLNDLVYFVEEKAGETLTLVYSGGSGERRVEKEFDVRVIELTDTFEKFFLTDGTAQLAEEGMRFESLAPMRLRMPYPIADNDLLIRANILSEKNGFDRFSVCFTDFNDASCAVWVHLWKESAGNVTLSINGESKRFPFAGSFTNERKEIFLNMSADGIIFDGAGQRVTKVKYWKNGNLFNGFASHRVRVSINTAGISETFRSSGILLKQVSNQTFSSWIEGDNYPPKINVLGPLVSGPIEKGETVVVPPAISCDVLSGTSTIRVMVIDPSGKVCLQGDCSESLSFVANDYGTYIVRYTAEDGFENLSKNEIKLYAADREAPQITVNGTVVQTIRQGEEWIVPAAQVADNVSQNLSVTVALQYPGGRYEIIAAGEKIAFSETGTYRLVYFCFDEDYNLARNVYEIEVTRK